MRATEKEVEMNLRAPTSDHDRAFCERCLPSRAPSVAANPNQTAQEVEAQEWMRDREEVQLLASLSMVCNP